MKTPETTTIKRVPVSVAAVLMGKTEQYIRIRLQRHLLKVGDSDIGSAVKISPALFMAYTGAPAEAIVREMRAQGKERYLYE